MSLEEKSDITQSSPRNKRHSSPCRTTQGTPSFGQEAEGTGREARPKAFMGLLREKARRGKVMWVQRCQGCRACSRQIHTDFRGPVEKREGMATLSERAPHLDRLLLLFWEHYFKEGPHLLCTEKDVAVYFTHITKKRMLQRQGEKRPNWLRSILGRINTDFRKLL